MADPSWQVDRNYFTNFHKTARQNVNPPASNMLNFGTLEWLTLYMKYLFVLPISFYKRSANGFIYALLTLTQLNCILDLLVGDGSTCQAVGGQM